jgi:hypothetical protein
MLDTWEAERLESVFTSGRTHPLVIECSLPTPTISDLPAQGPSVQRPVRRLMVVKTLGLPEVTDQGLFCEAFGNLLARELGITTPAPALVSLGAQFTDLVNPLLPQHGLSVRLSPGIGVGTEYFRGGFASVTPTAALSAQELPQAARIFAYDLLVQNPDRRPEKPNCGLRGTDLVAYDFELAFSFLLVLALGQQDAPWQVSKHGIGSKHLFYNALRGKDIEWQPFLNALGGVTDARLDELTNWLPQPWQRWGTRVCEHFVSVREHLTEFEWELRSSLT